MHAAETSHNMEKQAHSTIKGNSTNESDGVFTKVIMFFRKNKNGAGLIVSRQCPAPQTKNRKMSQILFETYSVFYNASLSRSFASFKSKRTKVIRKRVCTSELCVPLRFF